MKLKGIWVAIASDLCGRNRITVIRNGIWRQRDAVCFRRGCTTSCDRTGRCGTRGNRNRSRSSTCFFRRTQPAEPDEEAFTEIRGLWLRLICRMSRNDTAGRIVMEKEERQPGTKTGILAQLAELDDQAEKRRSVSADSSANALKAAAESERKIWESKMQSILEILEQQLSGDEKTAFFTEQRSWVRDRESAAVANSKKRVGAHWRSWNTSVPCVISQENVFMILQGGMKPFLIKRNRTESRKQAEDEKTVFCLLFGDLIIIGSYGKIQR